MRDKFLDTVSAPEDKDEFDFEFDDYDKNGDGGIDAEEFDELLEDIEGNMREAKRKVNLGLSIFVAFVGLIAARSNYFTMHRAFAGDGWFLGGLETLGCVIARLGALSIIIYGFRRWFSTRMEQGIAVGAIGFLLLCEAVDIITHAQFKAGYQLHSFQQVYLQWGAWAVLSIIATIGILLLLLQPSERLFRQEMKLRGAKKQSELDAKTAALGSKKVGDAKRSLTAKTASSVADQIANAVGKIGGKK